MYNSDKKEWFGPTLDNMGIDITMPFGEHLLDKLQHHGDKLIQINHDTGNHMTCTEMRLKSLKVAEQLNRVGIRRGDCVTIIAEDSDNLAPVYIGALAMGAIMNPIYTGFSVAEFQHFFELTKPSAIVCDEKVIDRVNEALHNVKQQALIYSFEGKNEKVRKVADLLDGYDTRPSEFVFPKFDDDLTNVPAFVFCTSGTTGLPKGCVLSHAMALTGYSRMWPIDEGVIYYNTSGMNWVTATISLAQAIIFRTPRIICGQPKTDDLILDILEKYSVSTLFTSAPNIAMINKRLESRRADLTKLRSIQTGGNPVSSALRESILSKVPSAQLYTSYGMSDFGGVVTLCFGGNSINSVGSLFFGFQAKIINEDGERLGPGESGEICLKKPFHKLRYLNNENASSNGIDAEGWFLTGDIGYFNDNGDLFVDGRKRDRIKYLQYDISAYELEIFIEKNFDISAVTVVGIPDDTVVHLLAAVIIAKPGRKQPRAAEINLAIKNNFSDNHELRGGVYFVKSFPHTSTGKLQRSLVQKMAIELYKA